MKLDEDCVRDILLVTEKYSTYASQIRDATYFDELKQYSERKILYHINQCAMAGLIVGVKDTMEYIYVGDLSPEGHEFLAKIRQDDNWNKTKEVANKIGVTSLDTLKDIATQVIANVISGHFNK